jgi:hypothetical protein
MHCSSLALSAKFAAQDERKEKSRGFSRRLQLPATSMLEAMPQKRRTNVRTIRIVGIALALTAILMTGGQFRSMPGRFVSVAYGAQTGCSNSSLRGNYGFQIKGTIVGLGPIGGIALITFDGGGNFTQTDNVSVNGFPIVPNRPGSGTYNVNADCTGTQTLNQAGGQVIHTTFVIAENGKEVFDEVTDSNLVITGVGKAVGSADDAEEDDSSPFACSLQTIKGSYAISTTGSIVSAGPVGAVADVGKLSFDGNGGASQTTTVSLNGTIIPSRSSLAGSYTVNPDCTGELSLTLPTANGPIPSSSRFVIVASGNQLLLVNIGVGRVLTGLATRQHLRMW